MTGLIIATLRQIHLTPKVVLHIALAGFLSGLVMSFFTHYEMIVNGLIALFVILFTVQFDGESNMQWRKFTQVMPLKVSQRILCQYIVFGIVMAVAALFFVLLTLAYYAIGAFGECDMIHNRILMSSLFLFGFMLIIGAFVIVFAELAPAKHLKFVGIGGIVASGVLITIVALIGRLFTMSHLTIHINLMLIGIISMILSAILILYKRRIVWN